MHDALEGHAATAKALSSARPHVQRRKRRRGQGVAPVHDALAEDCEAGENTTSRQSGGKPRHGEEDPDALVLARRLVERHNGMHLTQLYRDLDSPKTPIHRRQEAQGSSTPLRQPDEIATPMFRYQLRSLAAMLDMERADEYSGHDTYVDPALVCVEAPGHEARTRSSAQDCREPICLDAKKQTPVVVDARRRHPRASGGILCEEMGAGKTLISLSLILATRYSLPRQDVATLTSALAEAHWGVGRVRDAQDHAGDEDGSAIAGAGRQRRLPLPSLAALCAHVLARDGYTPEDLDADEDDEVAVDEAKTAVAQDGFQATVPAQPRHVTKASAWLPQGARERLAESKPFFWLYPPPPRRQPRVPLPSTKLKLYLSRATLVIVPRTLLLQWQDEMRKHVQPTARLSVLALDDESKVAIPPASELASRWDVVLLSHARFGQEDEAGSLQIKWPNVPRKCRCPYLGGSRTVDCRCPPQPSYEVTDCSPLLQCKFRRVVVDEGNVMAGQSGLVKLATKIACESRWIVSGTPTELMTGAAAEDLVMSGHQEGGRSDPVQGRCNDDVLGQDVAAPSVRAAEGQPGEGEEPLRVAPAENTLNTSASVPLSRAEANDVRRLGALLVDFLRLAPFWQPDALMPQEVLWRFSGWALPDPERSWSTDVVQPLRNGEWGARTRLRNLMSLCMVRNRPEDVGSLPPLRQQVVRLRFSRRERQTYNVLQAMIRLNAEFSERVGSDYLFHASNRKSLHNIITNLSLSCFHFGNDELVRQAREAYEHALRKARSAERDRRRPGLSRPAEEAIHQLRLALEDESWLAQSEEVRYAAELDPELRKAWNASGVAGLDDGRGGALLKADELFAMQLGLAKVLEDRRRKLGDGVRAPAIEDVDILEPQPSGLVGHGSGGGSAMAKNGLTKGLDEERTRTEEDEDEIGEAIFEELVTTGHKWKRGASLKERAKRARQSSYSAAGKASTASAVCSPAGVDSNEGAVTPAAHRSRAVPRLPPALRDAKVWACTSTKLQYVLDRLLRMPADEKAIVFSELDNALYELAGALEVWGLGYASYASGTAQSRRNESLARFKSRHDVRVLLMRTNVGGRGIDVSVANHVLFLQPTFDASLRLQAIKRCYRTGQRRTTRVEFVVMAGSFEEEVQAQSGEGARNVGPSSDRSGRRGTAEGSGGGEAEASRPKVTVMEDDPKMRSFISNPRFVDGEDEDESPAVPAPGKKRSTAISSDPREDVVEGERPRDSPKTGVPLRIFDEPAILFPVEGGQASMVPQPGAKAERRHDAPDKGRIHEAVSASEGAVQGHRDLPATPPPQSQEGSVPRGVVSGTDAIPQTTGRPVPIKAEADGTDGRESSLDAASAEVTVMRAPSRATSSVTTSMKPTLKPPSAVRKSALKAPPQGAAAVTSPRRHRKRSRDDQADDDDEDKQGVDDDGQQDGDGVSAHRGASLGKRSQREGAVTWLDGSEGVRDLKRPGPGDDEKVASEGAKKKRRRRKRRRVAFSE